MSKVHSPYVPPVYPFDRLVPIEKVARSHEGGMVDLSVGTPGDPPAPEVIAALSTSGAERGYPSGVGNAPLRQAASQWISRRFAVDVDPSAIAACIGTKELVAGIPHWLRLRDPSRDTVLYPSISYPTYAMGAELARCRAVPVPARAHGSMALDSISDEDASRALCLWVNSPSNPTGDLDDLESAAQWGRARGIPVLSDECYADYTWKGEPKTILSSGSEGVLAIHSISKRSNAAGLRVGFYTGDGELVHYLSELRRHAGFMVPGPIQRAGAVALSDDAHVIAQRDRYWSRLEQFVEILASIGVKAELPGGGFYLWVQCPSAVGGHELEPQAGEGREWAFTRYLAEVGGVLVSPGEFYGPDGLGFIRIALVQPPERLALVRERLQRAFVP